MFNPDIKVSPIFFSDPEVFDEKGSMYLAMRKTEWLKEGDQPDETKAKLELRKWRVTDSGERADKGIAFLTENGPHELAKILVQDGFGNTKDLLLALKKREDFKDTVEHLGDKEDEGNADGEFFDMRTALLAEDKDDEDDAEA
jgi:hypothetical protein